MLVNGIETENSYGDIVYDERSVQSSKACSHGAQRVGFAEERGRRLEIAT